MKKINILLAFAVVSTVFLASCNKDNIVSPQKCVEYSPEGVKVENQVVFFENRKSFSNVMSSLHQMDQDELVAWEKQYDFVSSYRKISEVERAMDTTDVEVLMLTEDIVFATIMNDEGVFVIGDTIHKITYDIEYIIPELAFEKLDVINNTDNRKGSIAGVSTFDIERTNYGPDDLKSVSGYNRQDQATCVSWERADISAWNVNTVSYGSAGVKITGRRWYKKNRWSSTKWHDDPIASINIDGCAHSTVTGFPTQDYCGSKSKYGDKVISKTFVWVSFKVVRTDYIDCEFTYQDNGCNEFWDLHWD